MTKLFGGQQSTMPSSKSRFPCGISIERAPVRGGNVMTANACGAYREVPVLRRRRTRLSGAAHRSSVSFSVRSFTTGCRKGLFWNPVRGALAGIHPGPGGVGGACRMSRSVSPCVTARARVLAERGCVVVLHPKRGKGNLLNVIKINDNNKTRSVRSTITVTEIQSTKQTPTTT